MRRLSPRMQSRKRITVPLNATLGGAFLIRLGLIWIDCSTLTTSRCIQLLTTARSSGHFWCSPHPKYTLCERSDITVQRTWRKLHLWICTHCGRQVRRLLERKRSDALLNRASKS